MHSSCPRSFLCTHNSGGRALKHQISGLSLHCSDQHCPAISLDHCCLLQSLQQRNQELLSVVRQLGSEKENEAAAMQAAKEEERKHVEEELSAIQTENARVQVGRHAPLSAQHRSVHAQTGTVEHDAEQQSKGLRTPYNKTGQVVSQSCFLQTADCLCVSSTATSVLLSAEPVRASGAAARPLQEASGRGRRPRQQPARTAQPACSRGASHCACRGAA